MFSTLDTIFRNWKWHNDHRLLHRYPQDENEKEEGTKKKRASTVQIDDVASHSKWLNIFSNSNNSKKKYGNKSCVPGVELLLCYGCADMDYPNLIYFNMQNQRKIKTLDAVWMREKKSLLHHSPGSIHSFIEIQCRNNKRTYYKLLPFLSCH